MLDREVDVGGRADAAVDQVAALDLDRLVDHRQGGRGGDGPRDRHVVPVGAAEHDPLAGVEVGGGQQQLVLQQAEVVGAVRVAQDRLQVVLDRRAVVHAGRQPLRQPHREVDHRRVAQVGDEVAGEAEQPQRHQGGALGELEQVGAHQRAAVDVPERGRHLLVDHPHHLLGGDAVGRQARHERAGARAHVDVELVDRAVDGQQVERPERADLVDAAREAAAAQHQGRLGPAPAAGGLPGGGLPALGRLLELDYFAHPQPIIPYRVDARDAVLRPSTPAGSAVFRPSRGRRAPRPGPIRGQGRECPACHARRSHGGRRPLLRRLRGQHHATAGWSSAGGPARRGSWRPTPSSSPPPRRWRASAPRARWARRCSGEGELAEDGVWRGDLYLRGGGDPSFGSRSFTRRAYGGGAGTVEELAGLLETAGIERVTGGIVGDESRFDSRRGTAYSGFSTSVDIGGPLTALSYNRGLASEGGLLVPGQPGRLRRRPAQPGAQEARAWRSAARPPRDVPRPPPRCWPASTRRRWRGWPRSPTSRRTTCSPRC